MKANFTLELLSETVSLPYPPRLALLARARLVSHAQYWGIMSLPYLTYPPILSTQVYFMHIESL